MGCKPETITTLVIGYIPIQNKKLKSVHRKQAGEINSSSSVIIIPTLDIRISGTKQSTYSACLPRLPISTLSYPALCLRRLDSMQRILRILLPSVFQLVLANGHQQHWIRGQEERGEWCVLPNPACLVVVLVELAFLCGHSFCPSAWP